MHIAVNLGVQKLASFQVDNLLPEEIDHEINMAVRRFINQRYSPQSNPKRRGFEQSQKRIDDLRTLLEDYHSPMLGSNRTRKSYTSSGSSFGLVYTSPSAGPIRLERFKLPIDYMYLINIKADLAKTCTKPLTFGSSFIIDAFLRIKASAPKPGMVVRRIKVPEGQGAQFVTIFESNGNANNMEELLNPAYYAEGFTPSFSNNDGLSDMFDPSIIADSPHADSSEIYLKYPTKNVGDLTSDGFQEQEANIVVGTNTENGELDGVYATVEYDYPFTDLDAVSAEGETPVDSTTILVKVLSGPTSRQREHRTAKLSKHPNSSLQRTLCKYVPHDDLFALLDDPFNTAKSDNLLYTIQENFVDLYSNNKTLPLGVTIKYLRKPANVNINAGIGCELAEHTHHEIVEMTVKSILEAFESPRYQSQTGEVLESE